MRKLSVLIITLMTVLGTHIASAQDAFVFHMKLAGANASKFGDVCYMHMWLCPVQGGNETYTLHPSSSKDVDGYYEFRIEASETVKVPASIANFLIANRNNWDAINDQNTGGYKTADCTAADLQITNGGYYTATLGDWGAKQVFTTDTRKPVETVDPNRFVVRLCGDNTNLFPAGFDVNGTSPDNVMTTTDGITYTYTRKVVSGHHPNNYGMGLRIHDNTVEGSSVWMQTTTAGELTNNAEGVTMVVEQNGVKNVAYNPTFADDTEVTFTYTRTNTANDVADLTGTLKVSYKTLGSTPVVFDPNHRGYEGFDFNNAKIEIVTSSSAVRSYAVSDADAKTSVNFADIKSATLKDVVVPAEFEGVQLDWNLDVVEDNGSLHFKLAGNQLRKAYFAFKDVSGFGVPAAVKVTTKTGQELTAVPCNKPAPKSAPRRAAEADADGNYWYGVVTNATAAHATEGSDVKVAVTFEEATVTYVANDNAKANGFQDQTSTLPAAIDNSGVVAEVAQSAAHTWPTIYHLGGTNAWTPAGQLQYYSDNGIYYIDNLRAKNAKGNPYGYKFSLSSHNGSDWTTFNAKVMGFQNSNGFVLQKDAVCEFRHNSPSYRVEGDINIAVDGTLEINMVNKTMTMHEGYYRPAGYQYIIGEFVQEPGTNNVKAVRLEVNPNELGQIEAAHFNSAAPQSWDKRFPERTIQYYPTKNGATGQGNRFVSPSDALPFNLCWAWDMKSQYGVLLHVWYINSHGVKEKVGGNFTNVSYNVATVLPGSKSTFDAAARLAEAPVQLTDWVDAPAGFPGNTAAHPVKIDKANQYTFTFKPALAVANATDVTYDYTVNGVAVTPVDNADGSKTVGMLPFDAGSRANAPVKLGITAKYTINGVQYTGATEYHDIARAAFDAKPANFVQEKPKVIQSGGFIHNSQWNVYSLCVPFSRNTDVNNSAYYICGMKVNMAPDFYTSTPQEGFQDFSYGVVGAQGEAKEFDRTPFVAAAGMDNIPGVTGYSYYDGTNWSAANNWADLVTKSNDFAVMLPHFFAQGANGNAEIKHGNAAVEFHAYYPVVYNPALLGAAPASPAAVAALAAGDKTVVESVKQTLKASANELAGASYAGDQIVTGVENVAVDAAEGTVVNVYNLSGVLLMRNTTREAALRTLPAGLYIIGRDKVVVE